MAIDAQSCTRCIEELEKKFDVKFYEYVWDEYTDILQQNDDLTARLVAIEDRVTVEGDLAMMQLMMERIVERSSVLPGEAETLGSMRDRLRGDSYCELFRANPLYDERLEELERSMDAILLLPVSANEDSKS
jgi:hypothetical protein